MRPSDNRIRLWPFAVVGFFAVATLLSFHTGLHLRESVPGEFRDYAVYAAKADPDSATRYWQVAVAAVQYKYGFGSNLPVAPPPEFVLPSDSPRRQGADASRQMYWAQLRRMWVRPEYWERYYDFDPSWSWKMIQQSVEGVAEFFRMSTH